MKSVKRGRGPSFMGGVGSLAAAAFGLFWMRSAQEFGASMMVPFGVIFIMVAVASAIYNFVGATRKNRFSEFDIVDGDEEPDPLNERFGGNGGGRAQSQPEDEHATAEHDANSAPTAAHERRQGTGFAGSAARKCADANDRKNPP